VTAISLAGKSYSHAPRWHRRLRAASIAIAALLLVSFAACGPQRQVERTVVTALRESSQPGAFNTPGLVEASGVVRSEMNAGVFWSQNDSGNDALLFAYDSTGASLGITRVTDASNRDWEAIALGPCASGSCLYIGDVGDNGARQPSVTIWRVAEPAPGDSGTAPAVALRFRYPDGSRDVESIWVSPDTSIWLLTKRPMMAPNGVSRPVQLYRLPASVWSSSDRQVAALVDSLPIVPLASNDRTWVTDASISSADSTGSRRLAVLSYERVFIFAVDGTSGRPGSLLGTCDLAPLRMRQGEGLVWLADGRLLFSTEGRRAPLHAGRCP